METDICILDTDLTQALRAYIDRRLLFALGRFGRRVGRVRVRITDLNGPRGGVDKACHVSAEFLPSGKTLARPAVDANLYAAIGRATQGIGHEFARALARNREGRRKAENIRFPLQASHSQAEPQILNPTPIDGERQ
jgi:putative sigma-54 modulation protein